MNSFGRIFRISIFGESHGKNIGVVLDGVPCGISLSEKDFLDDLQRRKAGAIGSTTRIESDLPNIISGVYQGKTTGAPLAILFENENTISKDYSIFKEIPRPSHSDFVALKKYNSYNDPNGSGHFSGRLTLALLAAGIVAKKILNKIKIKAKILEINGSKDFEKEINKAMSLKDSVGGIVECSAFPMPSSLGEPFFDSLESILAHLIFSIPGIKGIEFGKGFEMAKIYGSQNNDVLINKRGTTKTNHSGGICGGISNSNPLIFRVAIKPTSSIAKPQTTYNFKKNFLDILEISGRHDACIALRTPVIIEAATAICLCDLLMINKAIYH